ncbi:MAG: methyltransferase domain-containing protein [Muribaculum sp.]|nr:methyltransferase domain-containing protein [Muribaculum sp.]
MNNVEFFDTIAPRWDKTNIINERKIAHILDVAEVGRGDSILDVGTGTGVLIPFLENRIGHDGLIEAVDLSDGMLKIARSKFPDYRNLEFVKLDVEADTIERQFDRIMMYCMFPHLQQPMDTLRWLVNVNLRPGGTLVIAHAQSRHAINHIHDRHSPEGTDDLVAIDYFVSLIREHGMNVDYSEDSDEYYIVRIRA